MKTRKPVVAMLLCIGLIVFVAAVGYRWGYQRSAPAGGVVPIGQTTPGKTAFQVQGQSMAPSLIDGQVCQIIHDSNGFIPGDVVAVQWDSVRRVKRVVAVGGDVVDVVDGRLLVNGNRIEDEIADRRYGEFLEPALVRLPEQSTRWSKDDVHSGWHRFHFLNPHQAGRVTAVVDDYPTNANVQRTLNLVDRLAVKVTLDGKPPGKEFNVAFRINDSTYLGMTREGSLTAYQALRTLDGLESPLELSDESPIAIQMDDDEFASHSILVLRQVEYRHDRLARAADYPLTLTEDELFVVGDNVPVSVDSRTIGPILCEEVIGRVLQ